jgi:ABC-type transporter Mla subunit MlaD
VTGWQVPGLPRVPGLNETLQRLQTQSDVLKDLPDTIAELQRVVASLAELTAATQETMESAHRVSSRIESVLDEIEAPIRALRPGIERLAIGLDDPAVERLPVTLRAIEQTVLPVAAGVERARARWRAVRAWCSALVAHPRILARRRRVTGR